MDSRCFNMGITDYIKECNIDEIMFLFGYIKT